MGKSVVLRPSKAQVRKAIMENRVTPKDVKLPGLNLEESVLEIEVSPIDMVAAMEAIATSKERGGAERITLLACTAKNGPLHIFFRRKAAIKEKSMIRELEMEEVQPLGVLKMARLLKQCLILETLSVLELVGQQLTPEGLALTPEGLAVLGEGMSKNNSLTALCLNDSTGLAKLGGGMSKSNSPTALCLNDSAVGDEGTAAIMPAVGDEGTAAIMPAVRDHRRLARLQLCRCGLTDK
ncbi:hypothetical protein T484DRAFT_1764293 [Baffinella frigidus]|nr:hypothetical protein T484DRAFT_1764293 [Cryptophyta sp. CCMP2293]